MGQFLFKWFYSSKEVALATGMLIGYAGAIAVFWNDHYKGGDTIEKKMLKKWLNSRSFKS